MITTIAARKRCVMLLVLLLGDKISSAEWITGVCYNSVPITIIYFRSIEDMDSPGPCNQVGRWRIASSFYYLEKAIREIYI
jgi:hypothetical protein